MDTGQANCTPNSTKESEALDVKPLRTLAPMFPTNFGVQPSSSLADGGPFVYVSPTGPNSPSPAVPTPQQAPISRPPVGQSPLSTDGPLRSANSNGSIRPAESSSPFPTPLATVILVDDEDKELGGQIKQPLPLSSYEVSGSGTDRRNGSKVRAKRARRTYNNSNDLALVPSCQDPRESVEIVLMTYDALRRRLLQQEEAKEGKDGTRRPDLTAGTVLMTNNLRANMGKRIGSVPGVEVGDIFYFRMELCLVGLHAQSMGGIDCMTSKFESGDDTVAISVVSAGGYENEESDADVLIYSGQGGNANVDQKLERGNLALERSLHRGTDIRVIRSAKDYSCNSGKIYIYDGLYKVHESWVEKGKSGFNVFKYKLLRKPEQPDGIAMWKRIQKWKENPAARGRIILPDISSGIENLPVCLVNEVDDEKGPSHFEYVTRVKYPRPLSSMKPLEGCKCLSVCLPDDVSCTCAHGNGGKLPYSSSGFLVSRKPLIYECSASCSCSINCRNRLTQKGITIQFEVFKTRDRGWGLRSLDPIRAGTFICEYTGEFVEKAEVGIEDAEEDEYIFQAAGDDKAFKWNYGPELLGEPSADNSSASFGPLSFSISAKNMGNISRFINHSCSPNVLWQKVLYDHGDEGYPHIAFFAIKHIPPMTELTYDYGLSGGVGSHRPKQCLCGSPKCRGLFG
ncbi:histone-lysine N-methyltransferase, H3 lysine-9 specific SUVH3-like [Iris pallida]|uniref:Histone-lysine N-methyltransferase, H3 lysine-9 specific SUVH3-like n=1 Tax=Iris pallida TaxID=29817 RepID=A0AAX6HUB6_IRIPA|nr:histone-lysine N-methyltransferase, H3 lysine-9 specific SUVH3-like [Iris pallida]